MFFFRALILLSAIFSQDTYAAQFMSIKSSEVNARTGPGTQYPIEWVYVKKNEPVEIVMKFENWMQIKDISGATSWVHSSVLSPKRFVIIISTTHQHLYKRPHHTSPVLAQIFSGVRCNFHKCSNEWCKITCFQTARELTGWILRTSLWGISTDD